MDSHKNYKKEKPSFSGCWSKMSAAAVHLDFPLATYVKEIISQSTNTDAGEMITPAWEKRGLA